MKMGSPAIAFAADGSAASTADTSKKRPNTAFMARNEVAMPPLDAQELPSAESEPRRQASRRGQDALLHLALRSGLRQRLELLVGDQVGRDRHLGLVSLAHAWANAERKAIQLHHRLLWQR